MVGCIYALLFAGVSTQWTSVHGGPEKWAEVKGQPTTAELFRQHAAALSPATAPATPPDTGKHFESSPTSLPAEIFQSAGRGERQKVVEWLAKGGTVDELCPTPTPDGQTTAVGLLQIAAANGQLDKVIPNLSLRSMIRGFSEASTAR